MAKKVPLDALADAIRKALDEYADGVTNRVDELGQKFAKEGAKTLRAQSKSMFGGSGRYASGWTSQSVRDRLSSQGVIFNQTVPGLPHLLEHGHANRTGGRTPGRPHIAPVEEKLVEEFTKAVEGAV